MEAPARCVSQFRGRSEKMVANFSLQGGRHVCLRDFDVDVDKMA